MTDWSIFDRRPIVVAIAGPNGAGKTTFFSAHLLRAGLRFVSADVLAAELRVDPYRASDLADSLRRKLVEQNESFVFETVLSDPVGAKIDFLHDVAQRGYTVVMCFIGLARVELCLERVGMRVSRGGHDVPDEKLRARFPRVLRNLRLAIERLPNVLVFDNSDLTTPYRHVAAFGDGNSHLGQPLPEWLEAVVHPN